MWETGLGRYDGFSIRFRQLCQLMFPRRCPFCGRVLGFESRCPECERQLALVARPKTTAAARRPEGMEGAPILWAAAPYWHEGVLRQGILRAKYQGQPWTAVQLGCLLARALFGAEIQVKAGVEVPRPPLSPLTDCDLVVPVPYSGRERPYNVPSLMALPLARALGIPADLQAMQRITVGDSQATLGRRERLLHVRGNFRADAGRVSGQRVLLIDDVVTTGSTAAACAQALADAGAESVAFAALAAPRSNTALPAVPGLPFGAGEEPEEDGELEF